jgi:hypothetical protein
MKKCILILLAIVAISCEEDTETSYSVDPALQSYVDTFIAEAGERGATIEAKNLIVKYGDAQAMVRADILKGQRYILVNPATPAPMEYFVFNEMAGLLLKNKIVEEDYYQTYDRETFFDQVVQ